MRHSQCEWRVYSTRSRRTRHRTHSAVGSVRLSALTCGFGSFWLAFGASPPYSALAQFVLATLGPMRLPLLSLLLCALSAFTTRRCAEYSYDQRQSLGLWPRSPLRAPLAFSCHSGGVR